MRISTSVGAPKLWICTPPMPSCPSLSRSCGDVGWAGLGLHLDHRAALEVDAVVEAAHEEHRQRQGHGDDRKHQAQALVAHERQPQVVREEVVALEVGKEPHGVAPCPRPAASSGAACRLLHRVEPVVDEQPHDRDGREDRRADADGQRHGEAADRTGAEPEHDERAGKRRELRVGDGDERAREARRRWRRSASCRPAPPRGCARRSARWRRPPWRCRAPGRRCRASVSADPIRSSGRPSACRARSGRRRRRCRTCRRREWSGRWWRCRR